MAALPLQGDLCRAAKDMLLVLLTSKNHTASIDSIQAQLGEPGPLKHFEQTLLQRLDHDHRPGPQAHRRRRDPRGGTREGASLTMTNKHAPIVRTDPLNSYWT